MRLKSITLANFMGHRDFRLDDIGDITTAYGANWTGKSTVGSAFLWAVDGKDIHGQTVKAAGRAGFDIKTIVDGNVLHHLDHSVELDFETVTFKKTYREKWGTQNGSAKQTMTGHETVYFVDSVPGSKEVYEERMAAVFPYGRLFTDPLHFAGLPPTPTKSGPKSRREMLMEAFAADITDDDVISANPELEDVPSIIGRSSIDDYRKIAEADKRRIRQLLDDIPPALKELDRTLKGLTFDEPKRGMSSLRGELDCLLQEKSDLLAGRDTVDYAGQIAGINARIQELETAQRRAYDAGNAGLLQHRLKLQTDLSKAGRDLDALRRGNVDTAAQRDRLAELLKSMNAEYTALGQREFTGDTQCKACGQELPADRVQAATEAFNTQIAGQRKRIYDDGKVKRTELNAYIARLKAIDERIVVHESEVSSIEAELSAIAEPAPFKIDRDAWDYALLVAQVIDLHKASAEAHDAPPMTADIDVKIASLQAELSAAERAEQVRIEAAKVTARIKELQAEDKQLAGQHEGLVYNLGLLDNFARAKNRMMVDTINGHFKMAQFVLFEEQINGGMVDCCEITLGGRPWGSMSNSERINTGLDIIETLTSAMGVDPLPIIIDNAESVSHPLRTSGQQIRLVVSDGDKTLRVERDEHIQYTQHAAMVVDIEVQPLIETDGPTIALQTAGEDQEEMAF